MNFSSSEELEIAFENSQKELNEVENMDSSDQQKYDDFVNKVLKAFLGIHLFVESTGVFSKNEELDDIKSQDVKYLLVSYYLGQMYGYVRGEKRVNSLELAKKNYNVFLQRCKKLELLSKEDRKALERDEPASAMENRTELINRERNKKELMKSIKLIELKKKQCKEDEELIELEREYYVLLLKKCAIECLSGMKNLDMEIQMLQFSSKLSKETKEQMREQRKKYSGPMKITQFTKDSKGQIVQNPIVLNQREIIKQNLFKPFNPPTKTLEEYAEEQMKEMKERSEKEKIAEEKRKKEEELLEKEDEEALERKRKKDSEWDDWKDENPKGMGNMKR